MCDCIGSTGDGRVELLMIRLAVPIFDMFELSPLWRSVSVLLLFTQSTILFSSGVHVQSGLRDSGTSIYIYIFYLPIIFSSA